MPQPDKRLVVAAHYGQRHFRLLRYFSTASLITFLIVTALLGIFYGRRVPAGRPQQADRQRSR